MSNEHDYHRHFQPVADADVQHLLRKEKTYNGSWKRRGGVGAFMMLARKWDRLETIAAEQGYDIFEVIAQQAPEQGQDGTLLAEIRDLRRYLTLVEAEMTERGAMAASTLTGPPPGFKWLDEGTISNETVTVLTLGNEIAEVGALHPRVNEHLASLEVKVPRCPDLDHGASDAHLTFAEEVAERRDEPAIIQAAAVPKRLVPRHTEAELHHDSRVCEWEPGSEPGHDGIETNHR